MILRESVQELIEQVVELTRSYAIWWELVNVENFKKREPLIMNHEDFFAATALAHFQSITIIVYQLFDKRPNTKSFPNLIKGFRNADELAEMIKSHWPILVKVFDIRGNVYAHRNDSLHPEAVFARAKLSPEVIGSIVSLAQDIVGLLAQNVGLESKDELIVEFERRADCCCVDLQSVFDALEKIAL